MKPSSVFITACLLFILCFVPVQAYPWSSFNGGTHLAIDNAAYDRLSETAGFDPGDFPAKNSIAEYEGWQAGPDAVLDNPQHETYLYSNHYYNPVNKQGNAPERAKYWYGILVREIGLANGKGKGYAMTSAAAAEAAAYLGHYVADPGVPYHVNGNLVANPSPSYKDWADPDYKEIGIIPTGAHPEWEKNAMDYSCEDCKKYPGFSDGWDITKGGSYQIEEFVKKTAARTKDTAVNSIVDDPEIIKRLIGRSVQDVYTVYKAAYDEAMITGSIRWFLETKYGEGRTAGEDFILRRIVDDKYALVDVVPKGQPLLDNGKGWCGYIAEKYEGHWGFFEGHLTDEWKEKIPELFN